MSNRYDLYPPFTIKLHKYDVDPLHDMYPENSWKPMSAVHGSWTADIDFQLTPVFLNALHTVQLAVLVSAGK